MAMDSRGGDVMQGRADFICAQAQRSYGGGVCKGSISLVKCQMEDPVEPTPWECEAYEQYLHLPELRTVWKARAWSGWQNEPLVKPALQALEMTFRFLSSILCDSRAYVDKGEWGRRLESLTNSEMELISILCQGDSDAPTIELALSSGILGTSAAQEVWQRPGASPVVTRSSEESLLPRLATWKRAEDVVARIRLGIECHMQRAPFTLGLGEPNLAGKAVLEYDAVCQPGYMYSFKQWRAGAEDSTLCTAHQILEAWLFVAEALLKRVEERVLSAHPEGAARDCWVVERIWKLLTDTTNLLLLMDPDDFLRLKQQLAIHNMPTGAYCLRSRALRSVTRACKELRHLVPKVVGVDADPKGGPRLQEAAMGLFHSHGGASPAMIHLLQAFQAVEAAVKRFFFSYQQLVIVVMGSVEMNSRDALSHIYFEPPYFPSLDGAKTFLGDYWHHLPHSDASMTCADSFTSEPDQHFPQHCCEKLR